MKVFNITDHATPALRQASMANAAVRIGTTVIPAGGSATLKGTIRERAEAYKYRRLGLISIGTLPDYYRVTKSVESVEPVESVESEISATIPSAPPTVDVVVPTVDLTVSTPAPVVEDTMLISESGTDDLVSEEPAVKRRAAKRRKK